MKYEEETKDEGVIPDANSMGLEEDLSSMSASLHHRTYTSIQLVPSSTSHQSRFFSTSMRLCNGDDEEAPQEF